MGPPSDTAPLRVVFVYRAPLGGLFRNVLDLVRGQIARGHQVGMVCDEKPGSAFSEGLLADIRPLLGLGLARFNIDRNPGVSDLFALAKVRAALKEMRPDVVHAHGSKGGLYARLCAPRSAVTAYTPHGGSFNYKPGSALHRVYMAVEKMLERRTDVFLFESDYIRGRYLAFVGEPKRLVRVVRNGIHPHEFEPIVPNADAADLVYVGEFRAAKGLHVLAEALERVAGQIGRKPGIVFVGSGPDEAAVKADLAARGLSSSSTFLTPRPIREALKLGRAIVVASLAESLPYVSLEAAGASVPMISTDVGGIPEVFGPHGERLVPPGDAGRLADAIRSMILADPAEKAANAGAICAYVREHFTVCGMIEGVIAGYREAIRLRAS